MIECDLKLNLTVKFVTPLVKYCELKDHFLSDKKKWSEELGRYFEAVSPLVVKRYLGQAIGDLSLTFYKVIHSWQIKRGTRYAVHFDS